MQPLDKNKDLRELLNGRPLRLLIGGFPCTKFSVAQKVEDRETKPYSGEGWELFYNYLLAKEKFKPDFFLAENNQSIAPAIKDEVSKLLGVNYIQINSALVSAQTRKRVYWTNIPNVIQPEDRNIFLQDIIEYGKAERKKSKTIRVGGGRSGWGDKHEWDMPNRDRVYTTIELERLQTLPDNYTKCIPEIQRRKCIGNGWTAEVIIHILSYIDIPNDYPIEVLSMYDGIATGRYCLDKMGFTNVTYKSYEVDKYAIQVAMKNYPDIIQCGDAFELRSDNWVY